MILQMNDQEKLLKLFNLTLNVKWLHNERYAIGTTSLFSEISTEESFKAVEHVLKNLRYCTSMDVDLGGQQLAQHIEKVWNLSHEDTIIVGLAEPKKTCGSAPIVRAIEIKLPRLWSGSINTEFAAAFRLRNGKKNLIIVDDFIGTGDKISKRIARLKSNPKTLDYNIYVLSFASMREGLLALSKNTKLNGIKSYIELGKCISDSSMVYDANAMLGEMRNLERNLFDSASSDFSLGYMASEAAFYLEAANIPNNNFPILWWEKYRDGTERKTLFARR